jgi:DNA-binding NarL/FixJ family response regulator
MAQLIRILITDDHALLRAGLRALTDGKASTQLEAQADDDTETAWRVRLLRPGVILMDLVMSQQDSVQGMDVIEIERPEARILVPRRLCEDQRTVAAIKAAVYTLSRRSSHDRVAEPDPGRLHNHQAEASTLLARERAEIGSGT